MRQLRVFILFLAVLLYSVPVYAVSYYTEGYFQYHLKDTYASICGYFGKEEVVRIPSALGGKPVKEIEDYSFQNAKGVKEIHIPATVLSIGDNAFAGAEELKKIEKDTLESQKPEINVTGSSGAQGSEESNAIEKPQEQLPENNTSGDPDDPKQSEDIKQQENPVQVEDADLSENSSRELNSDITAESEKIIEKGMESGAGEEQSGTGNEIEDNSVSASRFLEKNSDFSNEETKENEERGVSTFTLRDTPAGKDDFSESGQELLQGEKTQYIGDSKNEKNIKNMVFISPMVICIMLVLIAGVSCIIYRMRKK